MSPLLPLAGRAAVVTGVSRRRGIGFAIASRLATMGASLFIQHYRPHDADQPWGADEIDELVAELQATVVSGASLSEMSLDLSDAQEAEALIGAARSALWHLDILVGNQAQSGPDGPLAEMTARNWTNTGRSMPGQRCWQLVHSQSSTTVEGGGCVWITSGHGQGPMRDTIAYAMSKAALAGLTASVADELIERRIVLNTVNPGPVNTGYLDEDMAEVDRQSILAHFPSGRFGQPDDPARLIGWLVSDEGRWVVGQVLDREGGFRRWQQGLEPSTHLSVLARQNRQSSSPPAAHVLGPRLRRQLCRDAPA